MSRRITSALLDNKCKMLSRFDGQPETPVNDGKWNTGCWTWEKVGTKNWQITQIDNEDGGTAVRARFSNAHDLIEGIDLLLSYIQDKKRKGENC